MEPPFEKKDPAYFREFSHSNQCELHFFLNIKLPGIGQIKEEIRAVRQKSDTVASLLQHIKNKLQKIVLDKYMQNLGINKSDRSENVTTDIVIFLKKDYSETVDGTMVLSHFSKCLKTSNTVFLQIQEQNFHVVVNAPLIKQLKLPSTCYATFTIQPVKFHSVYTDDSLFYWYRSTDKIHWEKIGKGFIHTLKEDDVGYYIKLVCTPLNKSNVQGPSAEDISETKVQRMGELPVCPFERRQKFTKDRLKGLKFRVVSYNILADRYTTLSDHYSYCSPKALAIDYRKQLILKELLGYNADIICLQEVDNRHYTGYFKKQFDQANYKSIYNKKGNRISEGLACIFDKTRYKMLECKHIVYSSIVETHKLFTYIWDIIRRNGDLKAMFLKQSTSLQVVVLKDKAINRCVIVGNTHLFYHPDADSIRLLQVNMATAYLNMIRNKYLKDRIDVSVVFCGDFNSNPLKSLYPYMIDGRIDSNHPDCLKIHENGKALLYHEFIFKSACGTPTYTNYTPEYKGCLDYIFIEENKLQVKFSVPLTSKKELSKYEGLPNEYFPSDHLALVVDLNFK